MSVYFAKVGRYIKVGYSENPERRVANLFMSTTRYSAPKDIDISGPRELVAVLPGRLNQERMAHLALDEFRVFGEWFIDEPELRSYLADCVAAGVVLDRNVSRPAGEFHWQDDPILRTDEDRAHARLVMDGFSAAFHPSP